MNKALSDLLKAKCDDWNKRYPIGHRVIHEWGGKKMEGRIASPCFFDEHQDILVFIQEPKVPLNRSIFHQVCIQNLQFPEPNEVEELTCRLYEKNRIICRFKELCQVLIDNPDGSVLQVATVQLIREYLKFLEQHDD